MKNYYLSLSENKRIIFWTILSSLILIVLLIPLCFVGHYDIVLGYILGVTISIVNFLVIIKQSEIVVIERSKFIYILFYLLRYFFYLFGLLIALLLLKFNIRVLNVFAVFVGYLPIKIIIVILERR